MFVTLADTDFGTVKTLLICIYTGQVGIFVENKSKLEEVVDMLKLDLDLNFEVKSPKRALSLGLDSDNDIFDEETENDDVIEKKKKSVKTPGNKKIGPKSAKLGKSGSNSRKMTKKTNINCEKNSPETAKRALSLNLECDDENTKDDLPNKKLKMSEEDGKIDEKSEIRSEKKKIGPKSAKLTKSGSKLQKVSKKINTDVEKNSPKKTIRALSLNLECDDENMNEDDLPNKESKKSELNSEKKKIGPKSAKMNKSGSKLQKVSKNTEKSSPQKTKRSLSLNLESDDEETKEDDLPNKKSKMSDKDIYIHEMTEKSEKSFGKKTIGPKSSKLNQSKSPKMAKKTDIDISQGVVARACSHCDSFFTSKDALKNHITEQHRKNKNTDKIKVKKTIKSEKKKNKESSDDEIEEIFKNHVENVVQETPKSDRKPKENQIKSNKKFEIGQCSFCDEIFDKSSNLKNHVLNHFKAELIADLPESKPFTCPECDCNPVRDKTTLLRHYAFTHKKIFDFCTPEQVNFGRKPGSSARDVPNKTPKLKKALSTEQIITLVNPEDILQNKNGEYGISNSSLGLDLTNDSDEDSDSAKNIAFTGTMENNNDKEAENIDDINIEEIAFEN